MKHLTKTIIIIIQWCKKCQSIRRYLGWVRPPHSVDRDCALLANPKTNCSTKDQRLPCCLRDKRMSIELLLKEEMETRWKSAMWMGNGRGTAMFTTEIRQRITPVQIPSRTMAKTEVNSSITGILLPKDLVHPARTRSTHQEIQETRTSDIFYQIGNWKIKRLKIISPLRGTRMAWKAAKTPDRILTNRERATSP